MGIQEWNQLNRDLWSALVHLSSGEAGQKVDNSGQGEGLIAYLRLVSWYNANSSDRKYEFRNQVLSPERCKLVSGVADAIERWESRFASVQQQDDSFSCSEGWKIALLRKILPESLDREVALRTSEL